MVLTLNCSSTTFIECTLPYYGKRCVALNTSYCRIFRLTTPNTRWSSDSSRPVTQFRSNLVPIPLPSSGSSYAIYDTRNWWGISAGQITISWSSRTLIDLTMPSKPVSVGRHLGTKRSSPGNLCKNSLRERYLLPHLSTGMLVGKVLMLERKRIQRLAFSTTRLSVLGDCGFFPYGLALNQISDTNEAHRRRRPNHLKGVGREANQ